MYRNIEEPCTHTGRAYVRNAGYNIFHSKAMQNKVGVFVFSMKNIIFAL